MLSQEFECPSCGAPIVKRTPGARSLCCTYCGQTSHLNASSLAAAGEKQMLIDYGSLLSVGTNGTFEGRDFIVLGRIRIDYEDGFWDEWYINYLDNGEEAWIQEDDGSFTIFARVSELTYDLNLNSVVVGTHMQVANFPDPMFVTSKSTATVNGGEGELPFKIIPGDPADFIDGIMNGKVISIEVLPNDNAVFVGSPFELSALGY